MVMEISSLRRELQRHATSAGRPEPAASATIIPFPGPKPKAESPWERYPCTRMHGASFEAEFHRQDDSI